MQRRLPLGRKRKVMFARSAFCDAFAWTRRSDAPEFGPPFWRRPNAGLRCAAGPLCVPAGRGRFSMLRKSLPVAALSLPLVNACEKPTFESLFALSRLPGPPCDASIRRRCPGVVGAVLRRLGGLSTGRWRWLVSPSGHHVSLRVFLQFLRGRIRPPGWMRIFPVGDPCPHV